MRTNLVRVARSHDEKGILRRTRRYEEPDIDGTSSKKKNKMTPLSASKSAIFLTKKPRVHGPVWP